MRETKVTGTLSKGDVREAALLSVSRDELVVDLGVKRDGFVPCDDARLVDKGVGPA